MSFDYGVYQGIFTLVLMVLFIAIVFNAYSKKRKKDFNEAANVIFDDDNKHQQTLDQIKQESKHD